MVTPTSFPLPPHTEDPSFDSLLTQLQVTLQSHTNPLHQANSFLSSRIGPFTALAKEAALIENLLNSTLQEISKSDYLFPDIQTAFSQKKYSTLLHLAIRSRNSMLFLLMLYHPQVDLNCADKFQGTTPLLRCASVGSVEMAKLLLSHPNIDPNRQDKSGWSPLHWAIYAESFPILHLLLKHPLVDPNRIEKNNNYTPLHLVALKNSFFLTRLLLIHPKIDLTAISKNSQTPLTLAHERFEEESNALIDELVIPSSAGTALRDEYKQMIDLLNDFSLRPISTRKKLRTALYPHENAATTFGLIVLLCDDYLGLSPTTVDAKEEERAKARHFFELMLKLPMELQMVMANRWFGFGNQVIFPQELEPELKWLLRPPK